MLERVVGAVLEKLAGKYIDGLDEKATQLSIWNGHVRLKDLRLKSTAFDDLDLPVRFKYSYVQELALDIPWKSLASSPLVVHLNGIYIVIAPSLSSEVSADERQSRDLQSKRARLEELNSKGLVVEEGSESESYFGAYASGLMTKVMDNIQLKVSDVHVRYEDQLQDADHPFCFGFMLKQFTAESTDSNWQPSFVENEHLLFKVSAVHGLSIYLDSVFRQSEKPLNSVPMNQAANQAVAKDAGNTDTLQLHGNLQLFVTVVSVELPNSEDLHCDGYYIEVQIGDNVLRTNFPSLSNVNDSNNSFEFRVPEGEISLTARVGYGQDSEDQSNSDCLGTSSILLNTATEEIKSMERWMYLEEVRKSQNFVSSRSEDVVHSSHSRILVRISTDKYDEAKGRSSISAETSMLGHDFLEVMMRMVQNQDRGMQGAQEAARFLASDTALSSTEPFGVETSKPRFIVQPLQINLRLRMNKDQSLNKLMPKFDADLRISNVAINVSSSQYRDIVRSLDFLENRTRILQYERFKPGCKVKDCPKEWWMYVLKCLSWERAQRTKSFDKREISRILSRLPKYLSLYKRNFTDVFPDVSPLDSSEQDLLKELEADLPFEAISVARERIFQEIRKQKTQDAVQDEAKPSESGPGIFSTVRTWFGLSKNPQPEESTQIIKHGLKDALKELAVELGVKEDKVLASVRENTDSKITDSSKLSDVVGESEDLQFKLQFSLTTCSFSIADDIQGKGAETTVVTMRCDHVRMNMLQRGYSADIAFELGDFSIMDEVSDDLPRAFKTIVCRLASDSDIRSAAGNLQASSRNAPKNFEGKQGQRASKSKDTGLRQSSSLSFKYESHPPKEDLDFRMKLNLNRILCVYNTSLVKTLLHFQEVGGSPAIDRMTSAAKKQFEDARKRSQQSIQTALSRKLVCDVSIVVQPPILVIPEICNSYLSSQTVMIFQPGKFSAWSMPPHMPEPSDILRNVIGQEVFCESKYYNSILLDVSKISATLCDVSDFISGTMSAGATLFEDVRISALIQNSTVSNDSELAQTKVNMVVPAFDIQVSCQKLLKMQRLLTTLFLTTKESNNVQNNIDQATPTVQPETPVQDQNVPGHQCRLVDIAISIAPRSANANLMVRVFAEKDVEVLPLFDLSLNNISLTNVIFANGSNTSDMCVGDIRILDSRPGVHNRFRKILEMSTDHSSDMARKALAIELLKNANGQSDVIVRLVHLKALITCGFLLSLLETLHAAIQDAGSSASCKSKQRSSQSMAETNPVSSGSDQSMSVHFFLVECQVEILEEDDNPSSRGIYAQTSVLLKQNLSNGSMTGKVHFQNLGVGITWIETAQKKCLCKDLVDISMDYAVGSDGFLDMKMLSSLLPIQISFEDLKALATAFLKMKEAYTRAAPLLNLNNTDTNSKGNCHLDVGSLKISILNDCRGIHEPVADICVESLGADLNQIENDIQLKVLSRVQISAYNSELHDFEPILEDWGFSVEYFKKQNQLSSNSGSDSDAEGGNDLADSEVLSLISNEVLNVNFMERHVLNLMRTLSNWQADWYGARAEPQDWKLYGDNVCEIRNRSGIEIFVRGSWVDETFAVKVAPNESGFIPLFGSSDMLVPNLESNVVRLMQVEFGKISMEHAKRIQVPIDSAEAKILSVQGEKDLLAVFDSSESSPRRQVTFHSRFAVENLTQEDFQVQLVDPMDICWAETYATTKQSVLDLPPSAICNKCAHNMIAIRRTNSISDPRRGWSEFVTLKRGMDTVIAAKDVSGEQQLADTGTEVTVGEEEKFYVRIAVSVKTVQINAEEHCNLVTVKIMPIFVISNLLPCPARFSFWIAGRDSPMDSFHVNAEEEMCVHSVDLFHKLSMGVALENLGDSSEFVPIFSPDGTPVENNITVFDADKNSLRLLLANEQEAENVFTITVFAQFWLINRTTFPIIIAQKWTASNVTVAGGQQESVAEVAIGQGEDTSIDLETILSRSCSQTLPKIFSFASKTDFGGHKACIRLGGAHQRFSSQDGKQVPCEWSQPFRIDAVGASGELQLIGEDFIVDVIFQVTSGDGRHSRTKMVTFLPKYVLYNFLHATVCAAQSACEDVTAIILQEKEGKVVCWKHDSKDHRLRFRLQAETEAEFDWDWTSPISMSVLGYYPVRMRGVQAGKAHNLMLEATAIDKIIVLALREYDLENPALKVVNSTSWAVLHFKQSGLEGSFEEKVEPNQECCFSWDDPQMAHTLVVRLSATEEVWQSVECDMDRLGTYPTMELDGHKLKLLVDAQGPTRVLEIRDDEEVANVESDLTPSNLRQLDIRKPAFQIVIQMAGLGISVIDHRPQEILYMTLSCIMFRSVTVDTWQMLDLRIRSMQIDNQTDFGNPVLLCSADFCIPGYHAEDNILLGEKSGMQIRDDLNASSFEKLHDTEDHLVLKLSKTSQNSNVDCYELVQISITDVALDVDESFLYTMLNSCKGLFSHVWSQQSDGENSKAWNVGAVDLTSVLEKTSLSNQQWVYLQDLEINTLRMYVTFHGSEDAHGLISNQKLANTPVAALIEALKALIVNVDRAPIVLDQVKLNQRFWSLPDFSSRIVKHYRNCLLKGLYRLFGSFEFLGNPTGLVLDIGAGIQGAFEASREGIKEGNVGWGIAAGAGSLAAGTVQGVFGSTAGLSSSVGKALAQLSFDGNYKRARALLERQKPDHVGQGLMKGGYYLGTGVAEGLKGVVDMPKRGYEREGVKGAIKGVGKGLIGAIVKPLAGVADLVSQTSEGIRNTPQCLGRQLPEALAARVRLPRRWESGRPVTKFDSRSAQGAAILAQLACDYAWTEEEAPLDYLAWSEKATGKGASARPQSMFWLILTTKRLVFCEYRGHLLQREKHIKLINAVRLDSILQVLNDSRGVYVYGIEENAGLTTRLALSVRTLLGLPAPGGGTSDLVRSGGRVGVHDGRVIYALRFRLKQERTRRWLLARLHELIGSDESQLTGEDWVLVEPVPHSPLSFPTKSYTAASAPISQVENIWKVLDKLKAQVTNAESHNVNRWDEYHEYTIVCTLSAAQEDDAFTESEPQTWTVYRRFREFVELRRELERILYCSARRSKGKLGASSGPVILPALPKRRYSGSNAPDVVQARLWALDSFLSSLLELCQKERAKGPNSLPPAFAVALARFLMCLPQTGAGP